MSETTIKTEIIKAKYGTFTYSVGMTAAQMQTEIQNITNWVEKSYICKEYGIDEIDSTIVDETPVGWYSYSQTIPESNGIKFTTVSSQLMKFVDTLDVNFTNNLIGKALYCGDDWFVSDGQTGTTYTSYCYMIDDKYVFCFRPFKYSGSTNHYYFNYCTGYFSNGVFNWLVTGLSTNMQYLIGKFSNSGPFDYGYSVYSTSVQPVLPTLVFCKINAPNTAYDGAIGVSALNIRTASYMAPTNFSILTSLIVSDNGIKLSDSITTQSLDDFISTSDEPDDGLTGYNLDKVRDGGSDTIPIPDVSYINSASVLGSLLKVYSISQSSLSTLAGELWSQSLIDQLYKTMTNPMSCIVNLRLQPISSALAVTSENLHIGNYVSAASGNRIDANAYQLDLGSLKCYMFFDNYIDYAPYTKVSIYLPFVGVVPLDTNEIMGSELSVKYNVDLYSGSGVAYVYASRSQNSTENENIVGCYRCNLAFNIPLTSEVNNSLLSTFATFTNPSSYINSVGTISNLATTQILNSPTIQRSSGLSANVGYMGVMYPYLIVERPIDYSDSKCLSYQGYDTLKVTSLSSGFNKYKSGTIKVVDDSLNSEEIEELKALLESGVVI